MKRSIPILVTAITGFLLLIVNFMPALKGMERNALDYFGILAAFGLILGAGSLFRTHWDQIRLRHAGWGYSVIVLVCFFGTLTVGIGKIGVPPIDGVYVYMSGSTVDRAAEVSLVHRARDDQQYKALALRAYGGEPGTTEPVQAIVAAPGSTSREIELGEITYDDDRQARLNLRVNYGNNASEDEGDAAIRGLPVPPTIDNPNSALLPYQPIEIRIGTDLAGQLQPHGNLTGDYIANGAPFWWLYEYVNKPLQQTTFAMLAFYVASAAFRAFRARKAESVLLLLTAFIILMGRTTFGAWLTGGLPEEGFFSFFRTENTTGWIMTVMNTAGNRAIMIGIALGVVATSLRILLGIDRSYLGSDKG